MSFILTGTGVSRGVAIGPAHLVERDHPEIFEYQVPEEAVPDEVARFQTALRAAQGQLRELRNRIPGGTPVNIREFIDTHLLMLEDSMLSDEPVRLIKSRRCNAEWALKLQRDSLYRVFEDMDDPYLSTRKDDIDHVVNRVQRLLRNEARRTDDVAALLPKGQLVIADDLAPADLALLHHQQICGFVTEHGGPLSHTAILARSLRIPAVMGVRHARELLVETDTVIVDGERGVVLVQPDERTLAHYRRRQEHERRYLRELNKLKSEPAVTRDGQAIALMANVELPQDIELMQEVGADGIGLYRTEFLFMNRSEPPSEEEQFQTYHDVVERLDGLPLTIRTLDLGADKQVNGGRETGSAVPNNPALGLRAVRLCLHDPGLFRPQLRAILRASAYGRVRMMIPMLSSTQELFQVLHFVDATKRELVREGHSIDENIEVGGMIEVPAAALSARIFAKHLDFLSIGTNDLIQYTLAIDRVDDSVSYLYDPLHPSIIKLLQMIIEAGQKTATPVAMCGEMAGDARYTRLLLGLGLIELSMHPGTLLEVKRMINTSLLSEVRHQVKRLLRTTNPLRLASLLRELNAG